VKMLRKKLFRLASAALNIRELVKRQKGCERQTLRA
jgi:hypothetical protein